MHDVAAIAVQGRTQIVKRAAEIYIRHVHVPVIVSLERLRETSSFFRGFLPFSVQTAGLFQDAIHAGGTNCNDIFIEHHEREPPKTFHRTRVVVVEDRLLLPRLEPMIAGNRGVVFVHFALALPPLVKLTG